MLWLQRSGSPDDECIVKLDAEFNDDEADFDGCERVRVEMSMESNKHSSKTF